MMEAGKMPHKGKISGRMLYTAEEYLKMDKYKIDGKLKRDLDKIEKEYDNQHGVKKKMKKEIEAKDMVSELCKKRNITSYFKNNRHNIKNNKRTFALIADRKNYVSVSTWDKGGKNFNTLKITTKKEMEKKIEELKKVVN